MGRGINEPRTPGRKPARLATVALSAKRSPSAAESSSSADSRDFINTVVRDVRNVMVSTAGAVLLACTSPSGAQAEQLRLSISRSEEVMQVQESMLESWSIVDDVFFDSSTLVRPTQTNAVRIGDPKCRRRQL